MQNTALLIKSKLTFYQSTLFWYGTGFILLFRMKNNQYIQKLRIINNWHIYLQSALYIWDLVGALTVDKIMTDWISLTMQSFEHISIAGRSLWQHYDVIGNLTEQNYVSKLKKFNTHGYFH